MMYGYRGESGWVAPVGMVKTFAGVANFHKLTDEQRAAYQWYPCVVENRHCDWRRQERTDRPVEISLSDGVLIARYVLRDRTLAEQTTLALAQLSEYRELKEKEIVILFGLPLRANQEDIGSIASALAASESSEVVWRAFDGSAFRRTPRQLRVVKNLLIEITQGIYERELELAQLIRDAGDPWSVNISDGWPELRTLFAGSTAESVALAEEAVGKAQKLVLKEQIAAKIETMPDEDKATFAYLYDEWAVDQAYAVGDIVRVGDIPYRVLQAHTSQADWTPGTAVSLFTPLRQTQGATPDEWVQPTGGHDAYQIGDRVTFNGSVYESLIDGNAHSPSAYPAGWQLVE